METFIEIICSLRTGIFIVAIILLYQINLIQKLSKEVEKIKQQTVNKS